MANSAERPPDTISTDMPEQETSQKTRSAGRDGSDSVHPPRAARPRDRSPEAAAAREAEAAEESIVGAPRRSAGPRWGRIAFVLIAALVALAAITAGLLWFVAERAVDDIPTAGFDRDTLAESNAANPQNFLVIGSDERPAEQFTSESAGKRSDTMMLVQIDPKQATARVLSLPRDTRVEIPGRGYDKLNASFAHGGPQLTIQTLKQFMGLPIHHYIEVNFEGLVGVVDALGGVEICVDEPMRDPKANIWFGKVGCYPVDGRQALIFSRSRNMQLLKNGKWEEDPTADIGRIHRQQLFLKAVLKKAMSVKALGNWQAVADGIRKGVIIDDGLGLSQFLTLYETFQDFDPDKVDMKTIPGHPQMIGSVSYFVADREKLNAVLAPFGAIPISNSSPDNKVLRVGVMANDGAH